MKKKELEAEIVKLKAQVLEARTSAVAAAMAKLLIQSAGGVDLGEGIGMIEISSKPKVGESEFVGKLRRMAEAAAAKGKSEP